MEKPTAQTTSQPMPPPQRGWSTPEPRAISPNPAGQQYFGRGRLMNDEPPRGLAPVNGHSFHPYQSHNVPRHNSLPSPLHPPERPSPPQHDESGHYDGYHPPPPPPGGSVGLAHYALSSSSGSASSQMQHPPSAQTPSASSASLAAFRLPPILQVEKQHVTTSATQAASASRRRNDALFKCPVPGCGSTFTRRFNLRGHLRSHTEERPFVCEWPGCGKGFARQHDCKRHQALHSSKAGTHACVGCGKTFSRMDALNRHLRSEGGAGCRAAIAAGDVVMMSSTPVVSPNQAPVSTALSQVTDEDWERPSDEESRGGSRPPSV